MRLVATTVVLLLVGSYPYKPSCRRPVPWQKEACRTVENAILASTVRIVLHGAIEIENGNGVDRIEGSISHATVIDGRYLKTHNHFGVPLSKLPLYCRHANGCLSGISIYRYDGSVVLNHGSLDRFVVISESDDTTLLDFGQLHGIDYFTSAGLSSATVTRQTVTYAPKGTEVALVDWDGFKHSRVVWAQVAVECKSDETLQMWVNHYIELGASGGGVFQDGQYIGNNSGRLLLTSAEAGYNALPLSLITLNP
jgi:hypothetical protein